MPVFLSQRIYDALYLRTRLLKRVFFRLWKHAFISNARKLIGNVVYESQESVSLATASIVLCTFGRFSDFLILSHLFFDKQLAFIAPRTLPREKVIGQLRSVSHVLYLDNDRMGYSFFRQVLGILRDYNRSIVISPEAAQRYASWLYVDSAVIVRIAMIANAPIIPVVFNWSKNGEGTGKRSNKCDVWIGKSIYISPSSPDFKDVFFRKKGFRKFKDLSDEDLHEIGSRIFSKLKVPSLAYGTNLSQEMATGIF